MKRAQDLLGSIDFSGSKLSSSRVSLLPIKSTRSQFDFRLGAKGRAIGSGRQRRLQTKWKE